MERRFGHLLRDLFDARQLADYEGSIDLTDPQIRNLIAQVEEFIHAAEPFLTPAEPDSI